ncbi:DUF559 domain-containing protein [Cellulomonas pakistanensis]|uniref:Restriction endonuclease type II-like domain-containing protein n=1 Tax=Cellulomonas pakistanensis TaxID=992287 RepID=A0A919PCZ3_9CELL|nr:DUF559 domain-containing protein [Cellulomonas pakistanensis]GIG37295.1 hypothetical protein Cpa01nite_26760 [Cellulomonas pakistanensis]
MPAHRAPLPPPLAARSFTVAEGRDAGLTPAQLRRASLRAPTRGLRIGAPEPEPDDVARRCREVAPALPPGALFCHMTALALLGVDAPLGLDPDGPLHVQVGPGCTLPRRVGVRGHVRSRADVPSRRVAGVDVLAPEGVVVQLAAALPPRELVVLGDALVRRRRPVCRLDDLVATVAALPPGTRGVRRLREALRHVRPGTDSPMETRLRWLLVQAGLPCPEVNVLVRDSSGWVVAMPDLAYVRERVAIEYDGDVHRTDRATWRRDIARRQALESLGWRVVTCTADDVLRHPDRAVAWVRRALRR